MKLNIELAEAAEIIAAELKSRFNADFLVSITPDPGLGAKIGVRIEAMPIPGNKEK